MVNRIPAGMLTLQMLWTEYMFHYTGSELLYSHTPTNQVAITLQQWIKKNKPFLRCLSTCLIIHWFIYYSVCLLCGSKTYRLSCSDQTSWADWGHHKGPFKQRRCNISPRVKHRFYFWHHKAVFKNNWEPTAVDSWKWSFGAVVWRREMLWRLSNKIAAVDPKKAVWEERVIEVVKWTWGRRTLDPVKLTAVTEFWECVRVFEEVTLVYCMPAHVVHEANNRVRPFILFSVFFLFLLTQFVESKVFKTSLNILLQSVSFLLILFKLSTRI